MSEELLTRLEQGQIGAGEIDTASRQRLLNIRGDSLRRRARLVFGDSDNGNRQAVVREYQDIGKLTADTARGRDLFMQKCAACHVAEGRGHAVGPDLAALSDRSLPGLLTAILDPSRAVEPKYAVYQVITADGRTYSGVLAAETAAQIELVEQENRRHGVPRSEIEELASSAKSLMPDGFEKEVSKQQLADLIGYLQKPPVPPGTGR
jgi:putative heme-binding domain-containing protein